jgi:hypothetical protein
MHLWCLTLSQPCCNTGPARPRSAAGVFLLLTANSSCDIWSQGWVGEREGFRGGVFALGARSGRRNGFAPVNIKASGLVL